MGSGEAKAGIGFFTVVRHDQHGLFGGFLLLNRAGRPLEFHCTAPLKPNRAQEILYGATLESYLYGEAIGATLLKKASCPVDFLCVDVPAALAVREFIDAPVALVTDVEAGRAGDPHHPSHDESDDSLPLFRLDAPHAAGLHRFHLAGRELALPRRYAADQQTLADRFGDSARQLDLLEPFARIRGAIDEAQRGAR